MNNNEEKKSISAKLLLIYCVFALYVFLFFLIGGKDVDYKTVGTASANPEYTIGELLPETEVSQKFTAAAETMEQINLSMGTYDRENSGSVVVQVFDSNSKQVAEVSKSLSECTNGVNVFTFPDVISDCAGKTFTLKVRTEKTGEGKTITLYSGTTDDSEQGLSINGQKDQNSLSFSAIGKSKDIWGKGLKIGSAVFLAVLGLYILYMIYAEKAGKTTFGMRIANAFHQYKFLVNQLVTRDFKVRYKRSVLGVLWSFVNPLLTMLVQFFVFSKIFRAGIPNYIVYLLIGITFFNFYSESTNTGLLSIVGNAPLIKKVYVPKYIYPISGVLSSAINFAIAIFLMLGATLISGVMPTKYILLLPYPILCIFILNIGVSLLISTGMVFFRDVQFLYNVFMTLLSYATPLFWSLDMMPSNYLWIFELNPLCDIITFTRRIIMYQEFPGSRLTTICLLIPLVILALGAYVFKKNQDKFVLYI